MERKGGQFKQTQRTVDGTQYTLQSPGPTWYYDLLSKAQEAGGRMDITLINRELLEHVVVEPKVTLEDFDTPGDVEKVLKEIKSFLGVGRQ